MSTMVPAWARRTDGLDGSSVTVRVPAPVSVILFVTVEDASDGVIEFPEVRPVAPKDSFEENVHWA